MNAIFTKKQMWQYIEKNVYKNIRKCKKIYTYKHKLNYSYT